MLQFRALHRKAVAEEPGSTGPGKGSDGLEARVDSAIASLLERREALARGASLPVRLLEAFDRTLRTSALERLDRSDVSDDRKVEIVRALHTLNTRLFSYHRFFGAIAPFVAQVNQEQGRPARVLELATGFGEFSLRCEQLARRRGLKVAITGSDIVPAYIERARLEAGGRGVSAEFRVLNAFDLEVGGGEFDVVLIAQSLHHFSPGQIARMIAESQRVGARAFVGVDGCRSLLLLSTIPPYGLLFGGRGRFDFAHDAFLSTRKFYSEAELEHVARLAAPGAHVSVRTSHPGYSILTADFR